LCESLENIAFAIQNGANKSEALNLRLTEQYLEALEKIFAKSSTLIVPEGGSQGVAEMMATYKHIMGDKKSSAQAMPSGNTDQVLQ
jgi:regulator of protease activity HflC (stomatin/prohibitin superfamily)